MEQKLESFKLFNNLRVDEIAKLISLAKKQTFEAGEFIFKEGELSKSFHIVCSGKVEVFSSPDENQHIELVKIGPGSTVGEVGFIDGKERTASVRCITSTITLTLTRNEFNEIIDKDPQLALKILKEIGIVLSERLRWCDKLLVNNDDIIISSSFLHAIEASGV